MHPAWADRSEGPPEQGLHRAQHLPMEVKGVGVGPAGGRSLFFEHCSHISARRDTFTHVFVSSRLARRGQTKPNNVNGVQSNVECIILLRTSLHAPPIGLRQAELQELLAAGQCAEELQRSTGGHAIAG